MIPTGDAVVPYFWVPSGDADAVEAALADSPIVEEVHTVDEAASEVLFRVTWSDAVNGIMAAGERVEAIRRRTAAVLAGE